MRDVVVDEIIYIDEKRYQQFKQELGKEDDYFNANYLTTFLTTFLMDKMDKMD